MATMHPIMNPANPDKPMTFMGYPVFVHDELPTDTVAIVISRDVRDRIERKQADWTRFLGRLTVEDIERVFKKDD